jgi:hypothetical protein
MYVRTSQQPRSRAAIGQLEQQGGEELAGYIRRSNDL